MQNTETIGSSENSSYESVEGTKIKMITDNTEVVITLNDSRAAADLVKMLPPFFVIFSATRRRGISSPSEFFL